MIVLNRLAFTICKGLLILYPLRIFHAKIFSKLCLLLYHCDRILRLVWWYTFRNSLVYVLNFIELAPSCRICAGVLRILILDFKSRLLHLSYFLLLFNFLGECHPIAPRFFFWIHLFFCKVSSFQNSISQLLSFEIL